MDYFGWLWLVALCSWLVGVSAMNDMGMKVLNDLERVSPIMLEIGLWEIFVCVCVSHPDSRSDSISESEPSSEARDYILGLFTSFF